MHLAQGVNLTFLSFLLFCFNWFASVAFMFFFLTSFPLLLLFFLLFLSLLVTSRLAQGWEVPWGAPLGPVLLSTAASLGKVKTFLSVAVGNTAGRVCFGCHRLVIICHATAVQVTVQLLCSASTSLNYTHEGTT